MVGCIPCRLLLPSLKLCSHLSKMCSDVSRAFSVCAAWPSCCGGSSCCRAGALGVGTSVAVTNSLNCSRHVETPWPRYRNWVPCVGRQTVNHCPWGVPAWVLAQTSFFACPAQQASSHSPVFGAGQKCICGDTGLSREG